MPNKTKDDLQKELEETKRQLAELEAKAGATGTATTPAEAMMKEFFMMMQQQQRAAEEDRNVLMKQINKQQGQIDQLMVELVDSKKKSADTTHRGPKPVPPPKLDPETTVAKFKAWRKAWDDYAHMCKVDKMSLEEQQAFFRSSLTLEMRDILEERIGVDPRKGPNNLLDDIEKYIRKKRSVVLDMVELDNRIQKEGESFDSYLVAIQQLAQDADLTSGHCADCKLKCLDRQLAGRLISGIRDDETRTKLLEEETFPSKDKVVDICSAKESAKLNNREHKGQHNNSIAIDAVKNYPRKGNFQNNNRPEGRTCTCCGKEWHQSKADCPAKDVDCNICGKMGHYPKYCFKREQSATTGEDKKFGRITMINRIRVGTVNSTQAKEPPDPSPTLPERSTQGRKKSEGVEQEHQDLKEFSAPDGTTNSGGRWSEWK